MLLLGRCYDLIYTCQIFKTMKKTQSIEQHHSIRYTNISGRYLRELRGCSYNIFKGLSTSQCRLSTNCLRLLSRSGKDLPGHEITTAVSLMQLLINLARCYSTETSTGINELYQQTHLKRMVWYQTKKLPCVSKKEQFMACSPLSL